MMAPLNQQLEDWLIAEREYLAQRPIYGGIPAKQIWHEDTIELRAYEFYVKRTKSPPRA
jgi:hypothetical protein